MFHSSPLGENLIAVHEFLSTSEGSIVCVCMITIVCVCVHVRVTFSNLQFCLFSLLDRFSTAQGFLMCTRVHTCLRRLDIQFTAPGWGLPMVVFHSSFLTPHLFIPFHISSHYSFVKIHSLNIMKHTHSALIRGKRHILRSTPTLK